MPENLTEALIRLADGRNIEKVWNPATRTGGFLAAAHRQYPQWQLYGCEEEKSQWQIAGCCSFIMAAVWGESVGKIRWKRPHR